MSPRTVFFSLLCFYSFNVSAERAVEVLPQPLSLQQALALAEDDQHPVLLETAALLGQADAEVQRAESDTSLRADLQLQAAYLEPSTLAPDQSQEDYIARLSVRKQLYDFGQSDLAISSAQEEYEAYKALQHYRVEQRR
ncbi:MAG: hypothetical protein EP315_07410, partial [Gammaproteobacteria bacterium]